MKSSRATGEPPVLFAYSVLSALRNAVQYPILSPPSHRHPCQACNHWLYSWHLYAPNLFSFQNISFHMHAHEIQTEASFLFLSSYPFYSVDSMSLNARVFEALTFVIRSISDPCDGKTGPKKDRDAWSLAHIQKRVGRREERGGERIYSVECESLEQSFLYDTSYLEILIVGPLPQYRVRLRR